MLGIPNTSVCCFIDKGNGDVYTWEDAVRHREEAPDVGLMIGRGALIKPWIFTEIKEQRFVVSPATIVFVVRSFVRSFVFDQECHLSAGLRG